MPKQPSSSDDSVAEPPVRGGDLERLKRQSMIDLALASNAMSAELFRWTLGSLLVVNGGALIAILGSEDLRVVAFKEAGIFFGLGLLTALLGGISWTVAIGLFSADHMKRAWDPRPLEIDSIESFQTRRATKLWLVAAVIAWLGSLFLFTLGCESMIYLPAEVSWEKLAQGSHEAVLRYTAATKTLKEVYDNPKSTPEERQAALERAETAGVDADIATERFGKALPNHDDAGKKN